MVDLKALSRRKRLNGREAGILEVEHACAVQRARVEGGKVKPVITDWREFRDKVENLDRENRTIYDNYIALYNWLLRYQNKAAYNDVMARMNLEELCNVLDWRMTGEETLQFLAAVDLDEEQRERMPMINRVSRGLDEWFNPASGELTQAGKKEANSLALVLDTVEVRIFYIRGYNYALDRAGELLDVPGVKWYKVNAVLLEGLTHRYNAQVEELKLVTRGAPVKAEMKQKTAERIFKRVTEEDIGKLDESAKAEMDAVITSFEAFTGANNIESYYTRPVKIKPVE